jgi:murein DD-endopeptidase MepM/ murein hydrolase activator NlpD
MRTLALLLTLFALPAQAANFCGGMVMPAGGLTAIARGFSSYHAGIDLDAPLGSTIRAAAAGTVIYAGWYSGYGNMIDVRHADGVVTRYAHISSFVPNVVYGAAVTAGQVIGLVGHTGDATGNHVHFEVRLNGSAVDPAPFIGLGRCVVQPPKVPLEEAYAPANAPHH